MGKTLLSSVQTYSPMHCREENLQVLNFLPSLGPSNFFTAEDYKIDQFSAAS